MFYFIQPETGYVCAKFINVKTKISAFPSLPVTVDVLASERESAVRDRAFNYSGERLLSNPVLYCRPREPVLPRRSWVVASSTGVELYGWRITGHAATCDAGASGVTSSGPRTFLSLTICRQSSGAADERPDAR